jgi:hypothetical protein
MNALKSRHESQSANYLRKREEQDLAKSKPKEEMQLLKRGHHVAVQGMERECAHEVQSLTTMRRTSAHEFFCISWRSVQVTSFTSRTGNNIENYFNRILCF